MEPDQDSSEDSDQGIRRRAFTIIATPKKNIGQAVTLTITEKRVLNLVSQSKSNREIAQDLHISHATVKRHIENILKKLDLRNRVEAAIFALSVQRCGSGADCPLEAWFKKSRNYD